MKRLDKLAEEITEELGRRMKKEYPLREAPADTKYIVRKTLEILYERFKEDARRRA